MDTAYKLAMKAQIAEIAEELAEIHALEAEQGYMPTMAYRAAERNLQLLVEACIGIAKQTLKSLGKHTPPEARQVFAKLKAEGQDHSQIPCAVMRIKLTGIWACLKLNTPFNSSKLFSEEHKKACV